MTPKQLAVKKTWQNVLKSYIEGKLNIDIKTTFGLDYYSDIYNLPKIIQYYTSPDVNGAVRDELCQQLDNAQQNGAILPPSTKEVVSFFMGLEKDINEQGGNNIPISAYQLTIHHYKIYGGNIDEGIEALKKAFHNYNSYYQNEKGIKPVEEKATVFDYAKFSLIVAVIGLIIATAFCFYMWRDAARLNNLDFIQAIINKNKIKDSTDKYSPRQGFKEDLKMSFEGNWYSYNTSNYLKHNKQTDSTCNKIKWRFTKNGNSTVFERIYSSEPSNHPMTYMYGTVEQFGVHYFLHGNLFGYSAAINGADIKNLIGKREFVCLKKYINDGTGAVVLDCICTNLNTDANSILEAFASREVLLQQSNKDNGYEAFKKMKSSLLTVEAFKNEGVINQHFYPKDTSWIVLKKE
jgi:hypothetical protein